MAQFFLKKSYRGSLFTRRATLARLAEAMQKTAVRVPFPAFRLPARIGRTSGRPFRPLCRSLQRGGHRFEAAILKAG